MKYYLINENFYSLFKNKEEILLTLIAHNSIQLETIFKNIDVMDFYQRCLKFYQNCNYVMEENFIFYQHPITNKKNKLTIKKNRFEMQDMEGFEKFFQRYHHYYFVCDDENQNGSWYAYEITNKTEI